MKSFILIREVTEEDRKVYPFLGLKKYALFLGDGEEVAMILSSDDLVLLERVREGVKEGIEG